MTHELDKLVRLTEDQIIPAAKMLTRAFIEEPSFNIFYSWAFPEEETREEFLEISLEFRIKYGVLFGEVYANSPNIEGLAVWIPSNKVKMTIIRALRAGAMKIYSSFGKDKEIRKKMSIVSNLEDKLHKRLGNFPHWYLAPIGVDPIHQGKGYASILMRSMLNRLDREQLPCYLETLSPRNVEIYEHYNFEIIHETIIPEAELTHWVMLRKPNKD
ncbi:MAG: GNAT family N-acetyltransferase [Asgard group archaeon]|nr:GNAT family N-acetyltransferase [Asgard group archaeon]